MSGTWHTDGPGRDGSPPTETLQASRTAQPFSALGTLQGVYGSRFINKAGDQFGVFFGVWFFWYTCLFNFFYIDY